MANFEVIVRPVVFPDIRPTPARVLPPANDPTKGFATIRGNGGSVLSSSKSTSFSLSRSRGTETQRRSDEMRVYQKDDETGEVNKDNYVDIKVANKIWTEGAKAGEGDSDDRGKTEINFFKRAKEDDNIELRNKDVVDKNPDFRR